MTVATTIPAPTAPDTDETRAALRARALRGLELYRERGSEIVRTGPSVYTVPGSDPRGGYTVNYAAETCECRDFEFSGLGVCKHLAAVGAFRAERRAEALAHLADLEDRAAHEDMDADERGELLDRIARGRRFLAPATGL